MTKTRRIAAVILAAAAGLSLSACSPELRDFEGAPMRDPDEAVIFSNVDQHPNLVRICIDGVGFLTTTREYGDAVTRVPEWDAICAEVDRTSLNGGRQGDTGNNTER